MKNVKKIVFLALLIAIQIILERFLSISTPIVRIGFGFLPIALAGILFGPVYAVVVGAVSDVMGFFLFPSGTYFPGFTISGALRGLIFGIVHYQNRVTLNRTIISSFLSTLICDLFLNTIWIHILTGNAYAVFLSTRIIKAGFMIPISILLIMALWKATKGFFHSRILSLT